MFNGDPISWKSRRQDSVALSTSEAEYIAASEDGKEVVYIRSIFQDFGFTQKGSTNLHEDDLVAVTMSTNPVHRKYSRHIDIHRHYVRELALAGVIKLERMHDMVADVLTKCLSAPARVCHLIHHHLFRIGEAMSHRN